jgi:hypothetical protein
MDVNHPRSISQVSSGSTAAAGETASKMKRLAATAVTVAVNRRLARIR